MKSTTPEQRFVDSLYKKYEGRVAIGVGYGQGLSEIYPFVFEDFDGKSIGIVALGAILDQKQHYVYIYHLSSFKKNRGNGTKILKEICRLADKHQIILMLSPINMPDGEGMHMSSKQLTRWYKQFGFSGKPEFQRKPRIDECLDKVLTVK